MTESGRSKEMRISRRHTLSETKHGSLLRTKFQRALKYIEVKSVILLSPFLILYNRFFFFFQGKYVILRDLAGLGIWEIENDLKSNCGKAITHDVYHSFTNFKRKSRHAVLNSLEDDLHVNILYFHDKNKFFLETFFSYNQLIFIVKLLYFLDF